MFTCFFASVVVVEIVMVFVVLVGVGGGGGVNHCDMALHCIVTQKSFHIHQKDILMLRMVFVTLNFS